jgi:two-component system nitrogen regulation sensor histidine kinase NtrY
MPAPNMKQENLLNIINEAVMLQKTAYKNVDFETDFDEKKMEIECDANQLMQVFTNVLKNAIESIEGRVKDLKDDTKGFIKVYLDYDEKKLNVIFEDNGRGLPQKDRGRLTEPYMTTRAKGTGLGLAIVKKIMEDHNGDILLNDRENGGAQIVLVFEQKEGLMGK